MAAHNALLTRPLLVSSCPQHTQQSPGRRSGGNTECRVLDTVGAGGTVTVGVDSHGRGRHHQQQQTIQDDDDRVRDEAERLLGGGQGGPGPLGPISLITSGKGKAIDNTY